MGEDHVRQALRLEAADAPRADDLRERAEHRIRWRRRRRWGGGMAAVAVMLGGSVAVADGLLPASQEAIVLDGGDAAEEGGDAPEAERGGAEDDAAEAERGGAEDDQGGGAAADPADWKDIRVGDAFISVPPGWEVIEGGEEIDLHVPGGLEDWPLDDDALAALMEEQGIDCPGTDDRPALIIGLWPPHCLAERTHPGILIDPRRSPVEDVAQRVAQGQAPPPKDEVGDLSATVLEESGGERFLMALHVGITMRTHAGSSAADLEAVLDTLSPAADVDVDEVLTGRVWPEGQPDGSEPKPLLLWAVAPDGGLDVWHETEASVDGWGHEGLMPWPGADPDRLAAVLRIDGEARVVAGRPGDEARELYAFPTDEWVPDVDAWSPSGHGIVWFDRDNDTPTAGMAVWEDADALADGEAPVVEQEVTVEGAEHPDSGSPGLGGLAWEDDDTLLDWNWKLVAPLERGEDGFPRLPDPLVFEPRG